MGIAIVVRLVALLLAALATGGLMVNWIGLARAMARVSSASAYTEFHQATNRTFDPYMPTVVFGALFSGIALAVVCPGVNSASGQLAILGVVCYAAGATLGGIVFTALALAAAFLNAAFDLCLGCQVYLFIQRNLRVRPSA